MSEIKIEELKFDAHNFNKHKQMDLLEKSITENKFGRSILLDKDNNIIAGNGITESAIKLGTKKVRVIETDGEELIAVKRKDLSIDSKEGRQLALADNATAAADLEWDEEELQAAMDEWGVVPEDWGVELPEMEDLRHAIDDNFEEDDNIPRIVESGDIWQLGEHRLMCGDSTKDKDFAKLMDGYVADLSFTSPPYNAGELNIAGNDRTRPKYLTYDDHKDGDDYLKFIDDNLTLLLKYSKESFYNIGLVEGNKRQIIQLCNMHLDEFKDVIYWEKNHCAPHITAGVINNLVEFILCFGDGHRKFQNAQFGQGTYWNVIKGTNASDNEYAKIHKATFPIYLPENIINNFCPTYGSVIDCFGGTGTTMIACEQLGRKCYMMEMDTHYCDIIIQRWETLTGKKAVKL